MWKLSSQLKRERESHDCKTLKLRLALEDHFSAQVFHSIYFQMTITCTTKVQLSKVHSLYAKYMSYSAMNMETSKSCQNCQKKSHFYAKAKRFNFFQFKKKKNCDNSNLKKNIGFLARKFKVILTYQKLNLSDTNIIFTHSATPRTQLIWFFKIMRKHTLLKVQLLSEK